MNSVSFCTSAEAVESLLALVDAQEPILDCTYGSGTFWLGSSRAIVGTDIDPARAKNRVADFTHLPFGDGEFPTVVFDPPFQPFVHSAEEVRYSGMGKNEKDLKAQFQAGVRESWRVARRHLLVKCQGYIHSHAPQWMPLWTVEVCGEPFEWLVVARENKRISGRWINTKSLRRNHADYLLFDHKGNKR
jgi:hypothetical protein